MVITAGYFDGDGSLDLAVGRENGDVEILLNNGSAGFSPAVGSPVSTSANDPVSLEAADLNADSIPDLALIGEGGSTIRILVGDGAGGFTETGVPAFLGGAQSLAVGDMNGDGEPDMAVTNGGNVNVLINQIPGLLEFNPVQFTTIQGSADFLTIADVNQDENADLVFAEPTLNAASVLLSLPTVLFEPPELSFGTQPTGAVQSGADDHRLQPRHGRPPAGR